MSSYRIGIVIITLVCLQAILFSGSAFGQMREVWSQTYESESSEVATCAAKLSDGGFILGGYQMDQAGNPAFLMRRISADGDIQWTQIGPDTNGVWNDVIETAEGNIVFAGRTTVNGGDAMILCANQDGDIIWMNNFGGEGDDQATCLYEDGQGNIYFAGSYDQGGDRGLDCWFAKTDQENDLRFQRFYTPAPGDNDEICRRMIPTAGDGLFLVGTASRERTQGWTASIDTEGECWMTSGFQGEGNYSCLYDVVFDPDRGCTLFGGTEHEGEIDEWMVHAESDSFISWEQCYDDDAQQPMSGASIALADDGGFFIAANRSQGQNSFTALRRTDSEGNELWRMTFDEDQASLGSRIIALDDGLLSGYCVPDAEGPTQIRVVRLGPEQAVWGAPPLLEFREDDSMMVRRDAFDASTYHHGRPDSLFRFEVLEQGGFLMGENYQGNIRLTTTPNFWGLDSVQVSILDLNDEGSSAWVKCSITPVNDPPSAPILFRPGRGGIWREDTLSMVWMPSIQNPWETDALVYSLYFMRGESHIEFLNLVDTSLAIPVADLVRDMSLNRGDTALVITWWVVASDSEFDVESTTRRTFTLPWLETGDDVAPAIPTELAISNVYPNPFNNRTSISFSLPVDGVASLAVFDLSGKRVADLGTGRYSAGSHSVMWDAASQPAGVYLLKLSDSRSVAKVERMVLLR